MGEENGGGKRGRAALARLAERVQRVDGQPALVRLAQAARKRLPGDHQYGDPLSVAGDDPAGQLGRRLAALTNERPSAMREVGLSALQVWQSVSEAQGRGQGNEEVAILFTDLVEFSDWALEAGDEKAVELLRRVGLDVEPLVERCDGRVVKRLGDGIMAVFPEAASAVQVAHDACEAVGDITIDGYSPCLRAGVHVGRPRRLGGDFFGVDVNIAARVAAAARGGEVLVSDAARERIGDEAVEVRKRWRFKAKGAPKDLAVYRVARSG